MAQDRCAARGRIAARGIEHEKAILFGQKEAGSNSVHANCRAILLCHMDSEPLREVGDGGFGGAVCRYPRERAQRVHRDDVDNYTLFALGHSAPEDLATLKRPGKIQTKDSINGMNIQVKKRG